MQRVFLVYNKPLTYLKIIKIGSRFWLVLVISIILIIEPLYYTPCIMILLYPRIAVKCITILENNTWYEGHDPWGDVDCGVWTFRFSILPPKWTKRQTKTKFTKLMIPLITGRPSLIQRYNRQQPRNGHS